MNSLIIGCFCGVLLVIFFFLALLNSHTKYKQIDKKYGKPYLAKLVKIIGDHPEVKRGSMAMSIHPKDAMAFNHKVIQFSQINSIKIIAQLPEKYKNSWKKAINSEVKEKYIYISVIDKFGEHEIIFSVKSEFNEVSTLLTQRWKKYNLFN